VIIGVIIAVGIAIGAILFGLQAANTIPEALAKVLLEGCKAHSRPDAPILGGDTASACHGDTALHLA
jgi:hypothetical protein